MSVAKVVAVSAAGILALAATIIKPWEGYEPRPYFDVVNVATVCWGHTGNVEQRTYSRAECEAILQSDIGKHWAELAPCIRQPLTENQAAAVLSLAFNVGSPAVCRSTLVRKINQGRPASEWCRELLRWNRAGGREVRGLTNRRKAEFRVCLGI